MNTQRCEPPLPSEEVSLIASSAGRYEADQPWVLDPQGFAADPSLSSAERQVLIALCRYVDARGACFPSIARLQRDTGRGRNAIIDAVNALIDGHPALLLQPWEAYIRKS